MNHFTETAKPVEFGSIGKVKNVEIGTFKISLAGSRKDAQVSIALLALLCFGFYLRQAMKFSGKGRVTGAVILLASLAIAVIATPLV